MTTTLNPKLQHIKRRKPKEVFEAIQNGDRNYEVCADTDELSLDVGDVITFQEVDDKGALTGRAFTKKVLRKESLLELKEAFDAEIRDEAETVQNFSILSLAEIRYRSLRSIYEFALTLSLAVDVVQGKPWNIIDGPFCAPPLASPDLVDLGTLNGLHLDRWPPGRYSIMLMVKIAEAQPNKPVKFDVIDLMVLVIVKDSTEEQRYGGIMFEELDPLAIMDGRTININGVAITPLLPEKIDAALEGEAERLERQYEQSYGDTFGSTLGDQNA